MLLVWIEIVTSSMYCLIKLFRDCQAHIWLQSLCRAMTKPLTYGLLLTFFPFKQNPFHKFQREITTQSSKLLLLLTLISSSVLKILRGHTTFAINLCKDKYIYWHVKKPIISSIKLKFDDEIFVDLYKLWP